MRGQETGAPLYNAALQLRSPAVTGEYRPERKRETRHAGASARRKLDAAIGLGDRPPGLRLGAGKGGGDAFQAQREF